MVWTEHRELPKKKKIIFELKNTINLYVLLIDLVSYLFTLVAQILTFHALQEKQSSFLVQDRIR